jgi:anti-anti-sigma factor
MEYNKRLENDALHIKLDGSFTIADSDYFLTMLDGVDHTVIHTVKLDFSQLKFIDSSALGLLLLLKHEAQKRGMIAQLTNLSGQVWKAINLCQFDKLFEIA